MLFSIVNNEAMKMYKIYAVKLSDELNDIVIKNFMDVISEERKKRVNRYRNLADKKRCMLAEVLLRYVLYQHYQIEDISFGYNEFGKPFLQGHENIFFNLSHSGEWVLCGIGDSPLGIDVEQMRTINLNLAKRFFHEKEYEYLMGFTGEKQNAEYVKLWTLKESYVKHIGKGLKISLDSFWFEITENNILLHGQDKLNQELQFISGKVDENHCYSICTSIRGKDNRIEKITIQELLKGLQTIPVVV